MKVICINHDGWIELNRSILFGLIKLNDKVCDGPNYGDTVTVEGQFYFHGRLFYRLIEWPSRDPEDGFLADQFVLTSEIDETEFERNYKKATT